jgi:hypothetical protein
MTQGDVEPLAALYRRVLIGRDAYRRALDPEAPGNFGRKGGMFQIHNPESLTRLLDDETEYVWVIREGERPLGAFWCGLTDEKYGDLSCVLPFPGSENLPVQISDGISNKTLYFSKEILIAPEERGFALAEALIHAGMRFFLTRGYRESCGEIYYVSAFRDEEGERPVHLFNNVSYRVLKRTGCRLGGAFPPCVVHADGFDVVLSIRIVRWDVLASLPRTREFLGKAGLSLEEPA